MTATGDAATLNALDWNIGCEWGVVVNGHAGRCPHPAAWALKTTCCHEVDLCCHNHRVTSDRYLSRFTGPGKCTYCGARFEISTDWTTWELL